MNTQDSHYPQSPIRVLHVFASLDRGGAEQVVMNLYRSIDRSRIQFDFVVNDRVDQFAYEPEIRRLGGRVFRLPNPLTNGPVAFRRSWRKLFQAHPEYKILHAHHTSSAALYFGIAKSYKISTIAHSHTGGQPGLKPVLKRITRFPLRFLADERLAPSVDAATWMFGLKQTSIINNAIDIPSFKFTIPSRSGFRAEFGISDQFTVGHIGRFSIEKNHVFIIRVFREIRARIPDAVLLLIGDGPLRKEMEAEVSRQGLQSAVRFTGIRPDIASGLSAMDLFLFPSLFEGLGLAVIEAQAAGLPSLISDVLPDEVDVTRLTHRMSLSQHPSLWAEAALSICPISANERVSANSLLLGGAFDIQVSVQVLTEFYLSLQESSLKG